MGHLLAAFSKLLFTIVLCLAKAAFGEVKTGSVATSNGILIVEIRRHFILLQGISHDQETFTSIEFSEDLTSIEATTGEAFSPNPEDRTTHSMATDSGNVNPHLEDSAVNTQGNIDPCDPDCEVFPPWATLFLCLATAFFVFLLSSLLFWIPCGLKIRQPSATSCSSSPRCSI